MLHNVLPETKTAVDDGSLPTLSFGQAMLVIIDYYQKHSLERLESVKMLYLAGTNNEEERQMADSILEEGTKLGLFKNFIVSKSPQVIDDDPVRRYFETHLAYETLCANASLLDPELARALNDHAGSADDSIKQILSFQEGLRILNSPEHFSHLTEKEREALIKLFKCMIAVFNFMGTHENTLSVKFYHVGFYSADKRGRRNKDRECKEDPGSISHHLGILKKHMPVPNTNVDRTTTARLASLGVDKYGVHYDSAWSVYNFQKLLHPFVSSISGTLLQHLSCITELLPDNRNFKDLDKLTTYLKCLISLLLYISGIHSLHEFSIVLRLKEVQKAFSVVPGFADLGLVTLFYANKTGSAFDNALNDTLKYNNLMLARMRFQHDIRHKDVKKLLKPVRHNIGLFSLSGLHLDENLSGSSVVNKRYTQ